MIFILNNIYRIDSVRPVKKHNSGTRYITSSRFALPFIEKLLIFLEISKGCSVLDMVKPHF